MKRITGAIWPRARGLRRRRFHLLSSTTRLLRLLVAVPLVAVVAFAGLVLQSTVRQVINADDMRHQVALSTEAGKLIFALQMERVVAAAELTRGGAIAGAVFDTKVSRTDSMIAGFQRRRAGVTAVPAVLRRIDNGLKSLPKLREQVRSSSRASLSAIAFDYRILIADLLVFRDSVAAETSSNAGTSPRTSSTVSQATEAVGQMQIVGLRSIAGGEMTAAGQQQSADAQIRYDEAGVTFLKLADPVSRGRWEQVGTRPQVVLAQRRQDEMRRSVPGERVEVPASEWVDSTNTWIDELHTIESDIDADAASAVAAEHARRLRDAVLLGLGMLLVLVVTSVLTGLTARRITRRLRSLKNTATAVAYDRLPAAVRELAEARPGSLHPDEVADRSISDYLISGVDEIAEVAGAVRALHREAVRIAGEQAMMRAKVSEIFVHLSRREQRLVDAMLAQIDEVERDEADPGRLQRLYRLDHLATRMGRINQSLLVLGGSGVSRVRQGAIPINNVIRAALSQIEQYTRVQIGSLDDDLMVAATAVDEIVHLLAELLDNATMYSAPDCEVTVTGHALADRAILQVVDRGVGLSPQRCDQLNAQLATPQQVDAAGVQAMGLAVVALLAARHGVRVTLYGRPPSGTVAEVEMPVSILARRPAEDSRPLEFSAAPAGRPLVGATSANLGGTVASFGGAAVSFGEGVASFRDAASFGGAAAPFDDAASFGGSAASFDDAAALFGGAGASLFTPEGPPATFAATGDAFAQEAETGAAAAGSPPRTVNGWFKTAMDGDSVVVEWPLERGGSWAAWAPEPFDEPVTSPADQRPPGAPVDVALAPIPAVPGPAAADAAFGATPAMETGLPRRVPQHHMLPEMPQRGGEDKRRIDPSAVAAAMSAYAKGVASRRAPRHPSAAIPPQ